MSDPDPITRLNAALEGRYRIERELGEDIRHERMVALNVLKPELAAVVGAERLQAEITPHRSRLRLSDTGANIKLEATPVVGEILQGGWNEHSSRTTGSRSGTSGLRS